MRSEAFVHTIVQHGPSGGEAKFGHRRFYPFVAGYDGLHGHTDSKANHSLSTCERLPILPSANASGRFVVIASNKHQKNAYYSRNILQTAGRGNA